jgi:hypothetical protein
MQDNDCESQDCIDCKPRLRRALEEPLSVLSTSGTPIKGDVSTVSVVSHSGEEYTVDAREGHCDCPDATYRLDDDEKCKHQIRAEIVLGIKPAPVRVVESVDVDELLGSHSETSIKLLASDGGIIDGETGTEIAEGDPEIAPSVWGAPEREVDAYNRLTGEWYVTCEDCGIEVLTGHTECATHRDGCRFK